MTTSAAVNATTSPTGEAQRPVRGHLYEIDLTRAVTVLSVIGVHVASYTLVLAVTSQALQLQNAAIDALHFTREIFLAITAFVLTYSYANKPFSAKAFWRKRGIAVLLPYVIWSLFYEIFARQPLPPSTWAPAPLVWVGRFLSDLLTGHASWQLYYILLTIEFYLILPWFLAFIRWAGKRPWLLLAAAFVVQVALLWLDYTYPQSTSGLATGLGLFIDTHQDRFLPIYEFYIICGALAALYMQQVRAWVLRHGALIVAGLVVALSLLWANFLYQLDVEHQSATYANSVYQPAMALHGLAVSAFIYWIALRWATARAPHPPRWARFWTLISDISFGIYLTHAYFVDLAVQYVIPNLPRTWPVPLGAVLVYLMVAIASILLCTFFLYTPIVSRLIGRPGALPTDSTLGRWIYPRLARVAARFTNDGNGATAPSGDASSNSALSARSSTDLSATGP